MSDIKIFRIGSASTTELKSQSVALEKSLQTLIEKNLFALLGVHFLASEYATDRAYGGRIDTLGIDENYRPVIIEYKRSLNENVINQGLFYLNWLMGHRADLELLTVRQLGQEAAGLIEWSSPRLLCIAGDFTKYDIEAVKQIPRNVELIRYRRFEGDLLLFELVNATSAPEPIDMPDDPNRTRHKTVSQSLASADSDLKDLFESLKSFLVALGDDVQMNTQKFYFAFKRIKNFACVEVYPRDKKLILYVKVDPATVELEKGFTEDYRSKGHYGTGDLQITFRSLQDLEKAKPLLLHSYESN